MKRTLYVSMVLVLFSIFTVGAEAFAAKSLYDDFSGTYLDSQKWENREFVREVVAGKLVSKIGNVSGTGNFSNYTAFQNPSSINVIQTDVTVNEAVLDSWASNTYSAARVQGFFYNTQAEGGATGDIYAVVYIGNRGNGGLEAWWYVFEYLDDNLNNYEEKENGTLIGPGTLNYGSTYTAKLEYNGTNGFIFTVNGISNPPFTGPPQQRAAMTEHKALVTRVHVHSGSTGNGTGYVSALFDDVYINNQATAYDDFSTAILDQTKWQNLEFVREISGGKLRLNVQAEGSQTDATLTPNDQTTAYLEAKVLVESGSQVSPGARGRVRIAGYYYNDSRGPGSGQDYNGKEGDVWVQNRIKLDDSNNLTAIFSISRRDTSDPSGPSTSLFYEESPIAFDTEYTLSIEFTGSTLIFKRNDETYQYDIATPTYPPSEGQSRQLKSRVYADPGESGYMKASFDDVYTVAFTLTYLAPGYEASEFLTLPFRTAAISFDSGDNLYTTDLLSDRGTGTINIRRFEAPNYSFYTEPYSYSSDAWSLNGLDFDDTGALFASEHFYPLDSGLIRNVFNDSEFVYFNTFRPTGIAATGSGTIYFPGRRWSDPEFGNKYKIDSFPGSKEIVQEGLVGTGIAIDDSGNIFVATREDKSIWASEPDSGEPLRIATSTETIEELTFDSEGNLYALEGNQDNGTATIIKISPIPPTVTTDPASSITSTFATLNGRVNPNGLSATYYFEYGTDTNYGSTTPSTDAGSGTSDVSVSANLTGLSAGTTYHFRIVATNSVGTSYGSDATFTTASEVDEGDEGADGISCFIATAAYGSSMEPHVKVLREFRDRFLLSTRAGRAFVDLYYAYSPTVADFIANHDTLQVVVRWSLLPLAGVSWVALKLGPVPTLAFILFFLSLITSSMVVSSRKRRQQENRA